MLTNYDGAALDYDADCIYTSLLAGHLSIQLLPATEARVRQECRRPSTARVQRHKRDCKRVVRVRKATPDSVVVAQALQAVIGLREASYISSTKHREQQIDYIWRDVSYMQVYGKRTAW